MTGNDGSVQQGSTDLVPALRSGSQSGEPSTDLVRALRGRRDGCSHRASLPTSTRVRSVFRTFIL